MCFLEIQKILIKKILNEASHLPLEMCHVKIFLFKMRGKNYRKENQNFQTKLFMNFIKILNSFDKILK